MSMIMEFYSSFPLKTCPCFEVVDIPEYHHAMGIAKLAKGRKERKARQKLRSDERKQVHWLQDNNKTKLGQWSFGIEM